MVPERDSLEVAAAATSESYVAALADRDRPEPSAVGQTGPAAKPRDAREQSEMRVARELLWKGKYKRPTTLPRCRL